MLQGDSGGGVYDVQYDELVAIVTSGPRFCNGDYSRYTAIAPYSDWLCTHASVCEN